MIASVKSIDLIDYENWGFWPDDTEDFCVAAEAMIGLEESDGADIFSFDVCTPEWFRKNRLEKAAFGRSIIFVNEYDEESIKRLVIEIVRQTNGANWAEIASKLCRYMRWEFEDYQSS